MKAFVTKDKYDRHDNAVLIIASTKKEALNTFENYIGGFQYSRYLKKDFQESQILSIEIHSLHIIPNNLENYGLASCFEFSMTTKLEGHRYFPTTLISEDEKTTRELIKTFKDKHKDFLNNDF